ncbi:pulmonary surfactant-associated protein C [Candoia aspera]|uniref:pulmonary surfactant-associated protein C n=1 Tax=Candoia aspera TaxID=51853 RepID=UPI002FD7B691
MEADHKMDSTSKEALMSEAPLDYTESPKHPGPPCRNLFIVVVVIMGTVLVVLTFLLAGLHITEKHTEAVLKLTIQGLDGKGSPQHLSMSQKERLAIFPIHTKLNSSATVVYDYSNLVIGYRSWPGRSCYIIRMNQKDIQSLDAAVKVFQLVQEHPPLLPLEQSKKLMEKPAATLAHLAHRSMLGVAINLLCSSIPIYWA